jgi:hypothetical protein
MASVTINGTALLPQPRNATWRTTVLGGAVNGTDAIGAAYIVTLLSPSARGGTASFNWASFENQTLTSITVPTRSESLKASSFTTYNATVVSRSIRQIRSVLGDIIESIELDIQVVV